MTSYIYTHLVPLRQDACEATR